MKVKIESLVLDWNLYPRNEVSSETVTRLVNAIEAGEELPPVLVDSESKRVVDGFHRIHAHKRLKLETIEARTKKYASDADIFAEAVRLNVAHGRPLDSYDIRRCIMRLEELGYSKEQIGEVVKIAIPSMDKFMRGSCAVVAGKPQVLKRGMFHVADTRLTKKQAEAAERSSGMQPVYHANRLIDMIENGVFPQTKTFTAAMERLVSAWMKAVKAA